MFGLIRAHARVIVAFAAVASSCPSVRSFSVAVEPSGAPCTERTPLPLRCRVVDLYTKNTHSYIEARTRGRFTLRYSALHVRDSVHAHDNNENISLVSLRDACAARI